MKKTENSEASLDEKIQEASKWIQQAEHIVAFTGAGISVESGIPPFRGPDGIWNRYDPTTLEIDYFLSNPEPAWRVIKEIFYDYFSLAKPNPAHQLLVALEQKGKLHSIITQNIDNLHQQAGSKNVIEYHGSSHRFVCLNCAAKENFHPEILDKIPPLCPQCGAIIKPDFVFFGEPIPFDAQQQAHEQTRTGDLWLIIGTTGEVSPACWLPVEAKENGARIIEINLNPSQFTSGTTDLFLEGKAGLIAEKLIGIMF